jgi:hypothetical protein
MIVLYSLCISLPMSFPHHLEPVKCQEPLSSANCSVASQKMVFTTTCQHNIPKINDKQWAGPSQPSTSRDLAPSSLIWMASSISIPAAWLPASTVMFCYDATLEHFLEGLCSHWGCLFLKLFAPKILWRNHAFPSFTTFNPEPGNLIHSFGLCKKNSQIPGSMVLGLGVPEVGHFVLLREVLLPEGRQTGFLWALRPALWFQCHIFWNLLVGSLFPGSSHEKCSARWLLTVPDNIFSTQS